MPLIILLCFLSAQHVSGTLQNETTNVVINIIVASSWWWA